MRKLLTLLLFLALWTAASFTQAPEQKVRLGPTIKLDITSKRRTPNFITSATVRVASQ
jgi:hypothetical protein